MVYPDESKLRQLVNQFHLYDQLQNEYGALGIEALWAAAEQSLQVIVEALKALPVDAGLAEKEPNDLGGIRRLRPDGPRRQWKNVDSAEYGDRLEGALFGRIAGNMLGAPVEGCSLQFMENLAHENGDAFPLVDYWKYVPQPYELHDAFSPREAYTRARINGVPVDDDLVYTLLGLLVVEQYGPEFSTEDIAEAWLRYLPFAYTAEEMTLKNLKAGIPAMEAGARDNPFTEWIGADIRSDPRGIWPRAIPSWRQKWLIVTPT